MTVQQLGVSTQPLTGDAEEGVLLADVVVVERPPLLLGEHHDPARPLGEAFEHRHGSHGGWLRRRRVGGMRVRLRPGATIDGAIKVLDTLASNAHNAVSNVVYPGEWQDAYVQWAAACEMELLTVLTREDVDRLFDNPRHRDIAVMPAAGHVRRIIKSEIEAKAAALSAILAELEGARDRMRQAPGCPTVIDTNLLLECQRADYLNWPQVTGEQHVRLVVPLRVLEELELRKYDTKDRRRDVAREVSPWLDGLFPADDCGPVQLRGRTTIELLMADRPRYRPTDADEEVLDVYHEVRLLAGRAKLVTMDRPMRRRAIAEGADVVLVDAAKYGRRWTTAGAELPEPSGDDADRDVTRHAGEHVGGGTDA